jgi:PAS domain S-box-containing protein
VQQQNGDISQNFGERLRKLRGDRSQAEFARQLGFENQQSYARYEAGRIPNGETLLSISQHLGVTVDFLLKGEGEGGRIAESGPGYDAIEKVINIRKSGSSEQIAWLDAFLNTMTAQLPLSTAAIVTTDAEGRVVEINPAFTEMCGYTLAELRGRKPGEVLQGSKTEQDLVEEFRRAILERRPFECTLTNYMRDGSKYRVHIKMHPVFDEAGNLIQFKAIERKL